MVHVGRICLNIKTFLVIFCFILMTCMFGQGIALVGEGRCWSFLVQESSLITAEKLILRFILQYS